MPTRRQVLAAAGAAGAAAASAGCTGVLGEEAEPEGEGAADTDAVHLGELYVQNNDDEAHAVQVAVAVDEEMLHMGSYDLERTEAGSSVAIDGPWADEPARYRVYARLDDGEVRTADVTDGVAGGAACVRTLVRVDSEGRMDIWNGAGCDGGED